MTALEFRASLNPDGTVNVPRDMAAQLQNVPSFRVLVLVPSDTSTPDEEENAWARLTESEFFRGYAASDSVYDDL
jgi:hypothetical protein